MAMDFVDGLLNVCGLLLWVHGRSARSEDVTRTAGISLLATLKRPAGERRSGWPSILGLILLLAGRSVIYWQAGIAMGWTPRLWLGAVVLPFRTDVGWQALVYSGLSFGWWFLGFYLWLLLLSCLKGNGAERDIFSRLVRFHLGPVDRWPAPVKLLLPPVLGFVLWLAVGSLLIRGGWFPAPRSWGHWIQQAIVLGAGTYLTWKYLLAGLLVLHLLNSHIFLGNHPAWIWLNQAARLLLWPVQWIPLRLGKLDLVPVAGIALLFLIAELAERGLIHIYQQLPLG